MFSGKIGPDSFFIVKQSGKKNSIGPQIIGKLTAGSAGTEIHVIIRPTLFMFVFGLFWFGIAGGGVLKMLINVVNSHTFEMVHLLPMGMVVFAYLFLMAIFNFESNSNKSDLKSFFEEKKG